MVNDAPSQPMIDRRVSLGNVLSLATTVITTAGLIVSLSAWGARLDQRMTEGERRSVANRTSIDAAEIRIRAIEQSTARQDEKLLLILESVREIKSALKSRGVEP